MLSNAKLSKASFDSTDEGLVGVSGKKRKGDLISTTAGCLLLMFSAAAYSETNASYTYDVMGRVVSIVYTDGTKTTTVTYNYDASGNRTSVVVK